MNRVSIGSDNGLSHIYSSPSHYLNKCWILSIWIIRDKLQCFLIKIQNFSFTKMHLKISSVKWRSFCPCGDWLRNILSVHNEETLKIMLSALRTHISNKLRWDFKPTTNVQENYLGKFCLQNGSLIDLKIIIVICLHIMPPPLTETLKTHRVRLDVYDQNYISRWPVAPFTNKFNFNPSMDK